MRAPLLALLLLFAALPLRAQEPVHVVQQKETLSAIARLYGIPMATLISLNGIEDPNKVKWGTSLKLPPGTKPVATGSTPSSTPAAAPVVKATPTAAPVVKATPAAAPAAVAPIVKPAAAPAATPAAAPAAAPAAVAKKSGSPDWRHYGPLQVDWNNWRTMAGSLVAPSINKEGQPLYVAVNCGAKKLNVTGPAGAWKTWDVPSQDFEKELVGAVCRDASLQKS
jgi:murein DD-endopeptidase MepM/ murein hydrolase activator NlpD